MSVATVRIAPVERWCEPLEPHDIVNKYATSLLRLVGQQIEIETVPMIKDPKCGGKAWYMRRESSNRLDDLLGRQRAEKFCAPDFICEHMLEMD